MIQGLSTATGKVKWKKTLPENLITVQPGPQGLLAMSTTTFLSINPLTGKKEWEINSKAKQSAGGQVLSDGKRWFLPVKSGVLCLNAKGAQVWESQLGPGLIPHMVIPTGKIDLLFCFKQTVNPDETGRLFGLDARDAKKRWETKGLPMYNQKPQVSGGILAFLDQSNGLRVLDILTGKGK